MYRGFPGAFIPLLRCSRDAKNSPSKQRCDAATDGVAGLALRAALLLGVAERPRRVPEVNYVSPSLCGRRSCSVELHPCPTITPERLGPTELDIIAVRCRPKPPRPLPLRSTNARCSNCPAKPSWVISSLA